MSSDSPIWDAWENLKAAYPSSTANWEDEPPAVWAAGLGDLTGDQLLNGLKNLVHHRDSKGANDFPPNMAQFRDLCLNNYDWEHAATRQDFTGHVQLEDLTTKQRKLDERKSFLAQLRSETGI